MADKVEKKVIKSTFLLRRGDESEWQGKSLNKGEPGFATDSGVLKVGQEQNGQLMKWEDLPAMITKETADNTYLPLSGGTLNGSLNLGSNSLFSTSGINITNIQQILGLKETNGITLTHFAAPNITIKSPNVKISTTNGTTIKGSLKLDDSPIDMNSHKITNLIDPTSTQDAATKGYTDITIQSSLDSLRTWLTADNMDNILPWPYLCMNKTNVSGFGELGGNPWTTNGMTYYVDEIGWVHVTGGQLTGWVNYFFADNFKLIPGLYNLSWACINYDEIGPTKRSISTPFVYVPPTSGYVFTPINGVYTLMKQEDVPSGATTNAAVSAAKSGSKIQINDEINVRIYQQYGWEGSLPVSSGKFKLKLQRLYE